MKQWLMVLGVRYYVGKIEKRITFKSKAGYDIELLTPETIKLPESTKKITKDGNGENVPHLEITEVVFKTFVYISS